MRLKRLTLHGYKTFASKTSFEFGEGITAIVGPNGSGKSNIADAIRWVLGEQSYSTLRGKKTTDMIFAGSQKRARAGMAQAILTLDNSEGWLPIDFGEIEISRRAYRSGENEYLLNGTKVRLRDVSDLLATSGLAHRTYTIIGQGLVDQALSLRADERRMLFEEAAGISHYKSKRAETLRRLQETDHNLERLHDIMAEIRPRLTSLKRQANRAENYMQVATDLRHHLRIWYGFRWERSKAELKVRRQASRNAQELWEESRNLHLELQNGLRKQRELVNRLAGEMRKLESDREEQRFQLENIRREVAVLKERKSALEQQALELQEELPGLKEHQALASQELAESIKDFQQAKETLVSSEAKLNQYDLETESLREEVASYENRLIRLQSELVENQNQLATTKGRLDQQRKQLSELELIEEDGKELDIAQKSSQRYLDHVTSVETSLESLLDSRNECTEELERLGKEQLRLESIIKSNESELNEIREQVSALVARKDFLGRLLNHENNLPEKLASVPRLLDHIKIPDEYKVAIESALGYRMDALLLEEESVIWEIDEQPSTRISLFIANRIEPAKLERLPQDRGVIGWASELVTFQENSPLAQSILSKVLIVENKRQALSLGAKLSPPTIIVSIDGTTVYPAGIVELGSIGALNNVLFREEEWISSNQELASLAERQHSLQRKMATNQNSLASLLLDQQRWQEDESKYLTQIEKERQILGDVRRDFDRARQQLLQIQETHDLRENQSRKLLKLIEAETKSVERLEEKAKRLNSELDKTQELLLNLPTDDLSRQRDRLSQQIENARTILAGKQAVVDSRQANLNQLDGLISRRYQKQQNLDVRLNNLNLKERLEGLDSVRKISKEIEKELLPLMNELTAQRLALAQFEVKADSIRSESHELETRFSQSRIELNQTENKIESLKERISADLGLVALSYDDDQVEQSPLPMDDIVEHLPEIQELPDDIEETIQRYRGQLTRMGGINPDAPAEYEATSRRYKQLQQQIEDLINTQQRLRGVIDELDEKTSQAFGATVRKVDSNFGNVFKRLFGGGSAKLILTDPDNLIDSGVEIVARLPRHREQGLALLSGGERSLTATALIFALLKVSPTPFCVLDEVDAMLDEANVNRFRELLGELSQQTQFILITHNRGTVQVAESVYGVSMGSDSASQVISIRPEDYLVSAALVT